MRADGVKGMRALGLLLTQLGCLPASTFTSARTIPKGSFEHVASVEGTNAVYDRNTSWPGAVPSYGLRYGLGDRVELGGRI